MYIKIGLFSLLIFVLCCACSSDFYQINSKKKELQSLTTNVNNYLHEMNKVIYSAAQITDSLYINQDQIIKKTDKKKYRLHPTGVFYKPVNDSGSAVYITGFVPVNEQLKKVIYLTEPLDSYFVEIINQYPEISQIYYNDKNSCNRIYPYFDVLTQYEPKTDITSFNFYYLADEKNNPLKKNVWVNEPYIDPAGRGWMISIIAPVYFKERLEGVIGLDIDIDRVIQKYRHSGELSYIILMPDGRVVSATSDLQMLLDLPDCKSVKYIEAITKDQTRSNDFNLLNNSNSDVRNLAEKISQNKKNLTVSLKDKIYYVLSEDIPELNWKMISFIKK